MKKLARFPTIFLGLVALLLVGGFAVERFFFSSIVFKSGGTLDFEIGQTREEAFKTAQDLVTQGRVAEIHTWPTGKVHRPFRDDETPAIDDSPSWSIVVDPDWWNNSVTLTFREGRIVQIRRNRILWELP